MENKKTILLVDDEVKITQVLTAYLEKAGYQTVCAHDGKEASRLLQSQSFSLIILDLMLPDISGESLCRTIRTHYRTPVIMLTAKSEEADAYAQSQQIKGEGDAEAIRIYGEAFQKDPDFYEFIRTLETYEKTIDGNTTLILPSTAEILKYLSGNSTQN